MDENDLPREEGLVLAGLAAVYEVLGAIFFLIISLDHTRPI